jgi:hypothetical protein
MRNIQFPSAQLATANTIYKALRATQVTLIQLEEEMRAFNVPSEVYELVRKQECRKLTNLCTKLNITEGKACEIVINNISDAANRKYIGDGFAVLEYVAYTRGYAPSYGINEYSL